MSQNDFSIANQTSGNARVDINSALQALASTSSGTSEPATKYANMLWYDTTNDTLKMRNEANSAWITIGTLNQSTNVFTPAQWSPPSTAISALPGILASGTAAAGVLAGATWTTIPINSLPVNSIAGASLSASNITLPAGTYYVKWVHPFGFSGGGAAILRTRVYNVTDSSVALAGQDGVQIGENYSGVQVHGMGVFILGGSKSIRVQGYSDSGGDVTALKGLYLEIYKTA